MPYQKELSRDARGKFTRVEWLKLWLQNDYSNKTTRPSIFVCFYIAHYHIHNDLKKLAFIK